MSDVSQRARLDAAGLDALIQLTDTIEKEFERAAHLSTRGKVMEALGTLIRVSGIDVRYGELCELRTGHGELMQYAEVVGFSRDTVLLSPFGRLDGLSRDTQVVALRRPLAIPVGPALFGRVVDSMGQPIDGRGPIETEQTAALYAAPPDAMSRPLLDRPLDTGVRVVDGMMTLGEGQRVGIFAPAGVGKSTLMGMFARGTRCDLNVIALIGERGREVREFIEQILGPEGIARSVVVCATSDRSSIERVKAAYSATAIAEYFRNRGMRVLLMMDSLTRFARAQREIGLAAGEPPARRGFPPSIFAELPRLLERAGLSEHGSITALYTVLAEDESGSDPIAEEVRGILDGHMILSREIAARNQYPAIDVLASLSRVMPQVTDSAHREAAGHVRRLLAKHREIETLLQLGEYRAGGDPVADEAVRKIEAIRQFLCQRTDEFSARDATLAALRGLHA
ncbi:type III secretion system ATPase SctN [Trinickia caryophylli]|uniref:Type 3 secretion system ATPase n=1 Tax=Trinickia caryophylli TaxID=28094 RepID=A0A1X7ECS7_TRICW|nr:type III secretion system ATPase SctN [Trinickia caryophylli]PMS12897.1 EscN/YscN/HrcN family type III secretion system ATPase [Trinickia caryophylli]TRX14651.1 EscN/YscN/HrcN family type III secretion system ATPase [Trinickia caryophylli]WQE14496.1 type III secretion system ATPase SctN [Trinickia caryophylli]SMF31714.1 ATP synthase in type III secretion protein N [Trinickia caryophylli]GLU32100.1 EscN/YscN/HrcN family type III secretion system ATPase [Trinickia caryophylli]